MSEFYEFASDSPMLTFWLGCLSVLAFTVCCDLILKIVSRVTRAITIWLHGYPPMWCDASGEFPKPEKPADAGKDQK